VSRINPGSPAPFRRTKRAISGKKVAARGDAAGQFRGISGREYVKVWGLFVRLADEARVGFFVMCGSAPRLGTARLGAVWRIRRGRTLHDFAVIHLARCGVTRRRPGLAVPSVVHRPPLKAGRGPDRPAYSIQCLLDRFVPAVVLA